MKSPNKGDNVSNFQTLKKDLLAKVAEEFAVDLPEDLDSITKAQIIAALAEDGVTWDMYKQAFPSEMDQPNVDNPIPAPAVTKEAPAAKRTVLLRMGRANPRYDVRGYTFTREHPYLPVDEDNANWILDNVEGFYVASPREVDEFYS
jgi:hypothetical protein